MPIHVWTRVDAGIFHAFDHFWITEISPGNKNNRNGLNAFSSTADNLKNSLPNLEASDGRGRPSYSGHFFGL
jgi:hypothetical protein